jgi:hypothetical protein
MLGGFTMIVYMIQYVEAYLILLGKEKCHELQ